MRVLSLFSGGGLGDYGLMLAGMEIVGQVEIDEYCQKILKLRWPGVPKWRDIRDVKGEEIKRVCGTVDLIAGGFPCQPFSTAGRRTGKDDNRYLWPEMLRIIREIKPRWVLAENVPGLLSISNGRIFGEVVRDLAESGYCVEWDCIPASALGAPHQRDRVWIIGRLQHTDTDKSIFSTEQKRKYEWSQDNGGVGQVANSEQSRCNGEGLSICREKSEKVFMPTGTSQEMADTQRTKCPWCGRKTWSGGDKFGCGCWWKSEPGMGRMVNGVTYRMDKLAKRIEVLGNGQVPQVVCLIGKRIMEFDKQLIPEE